MCLLKIPARTYGSSKKFVGYKARTIIFVPQRNTRRKEGKVLVELLITDIFSSLKYNNGIGRLRTSNDIYLL